MLSAEEPAINGENCTTRTCLVYQDLWYHEFYLRTLELSCCKTIRKPLVLNTIIQFLTA